MGQRHFNECAKLLGYKSSGSRLTDGYIATGRIGDNPYIKLLLET